MECLRIHSSFEHSLPDLTTATGENGNYLENSELTRLNEEQANSATNFSSFLSSQTNALVSDEICMTSGD